MIREKLLSSPTSRFSSLSYTPSSSSSTLSFLLRSVHHPSLPTTSNPPLFFLLNTFFFFFFISLAVERLLADIATVLVRIAGHVPSLLRPTYRIFLAEFHGRSRDSETVYSNISRVQPSCYWKKIVLEKGYIFPSNLHKINTL